MAKSFTLRVKTEFSAAHALRGYEGDCARIHGHNWKLEAEIVTASLNDIGIGIDFKDVKRAMREIADIIEHQYLNEIPPFDRLNPTAENIAAWFYQQLAPIINDASRRLAAVTLWETERSSVRYAEYD